jgi:hypothetical protein
MLAQAPDYYETSAIYRKIQTAQGNEYDSVEAKNADLKAQLRIKTATWGLRYYEEAYGIPVIESDSYGIRRSRVLSKCRGAGQFSAAMIERMAEAYSGGEVEVTMDIPTGTVNVKFIGTRGVPTNIEDLKTAIDNVIHAHLGIEYSFTYYLYSDLKASGMTYGGVAATGKTYNEIYNRGLA